MNRQTGFTLIELIAVVVVLGVLAAVAVPKFVNLQSSARQAALNGTLGAMQTVDVEVYSKSIIDGVNINTSNQTVSFDGITNIEVTLGYPESVAESSSQWDITDLVDLTGNLQVQPTSQSLYIGYDTNKDGSITAVDNCHILRRDANSTTRKPSYSLSLSKC